MMISVNKNVIDAVVINLCQCSNSGMYMNQKKEKYCGRIDVGDIQVLNG